MPRPEINKALRFTAIAGDLEITEQVINPLPANELLVRVRAASINPVDIQLWRSGLVGVVAGDKGMGRDFAGIIVEVGRDVKGWAEGDEVFGLLFHVFGQGTFGEYINVNPSSDPIVRKPASLEFEAAASAPLVSLTAFACLDWMPPAIGSQRKVIVRGASGGAGSWVVQLAKTAYDCHVTAICSARNVDYVKKLGANEVIDYSSESVIDALLEKRSSSNEYDLLVDCVGGPELLGVYPQILHNKGAYVTVVGDKTNPRHIGGPMTYFTHPSQIIRYIKGWIWGPRYACISMAMKSEYLEKVASLFEQGELQFPIQEVIKDAFDEERQGWRRAIELIESRRIQGKVVLEIP
ncbi:chaperonin 10-like protein [Xylogone sp. PMI_703]|nr:chaperonin 10-like protein [Xylogone sp. PMI_703]